MGASSWDYLTEYDPDDTKALQRLRQQVFDSGDWSWTEDEDDRPTSLAEWEETDTAHIAGSHTIMDIFEVVATLDESDPGATVAVTDTEALAAFGTTTPTNTDIECVGGPNGTTMDDLVRGRGEGRHLTVYKDGTPHQILFWGYSGD